MRIIIAACVLVSACGGGGDSAQAAPTQAAPATAASTTVTAAVTESDIADLRQEIAALRQELELSSTTVHTEDGTAIGRVISLEVGFAYWITYGDRQARLRLDRYPGTYDWSLPVFFEGANCTGQAYMMDNSGALIEPVGGQTDYYLPTYGTEPQTIYIASRLDAQGPTPCWDWNRTVPTLLPAEIVLPDPGPLHLRF